MITITFNAFSFLQKRFKEQKLPYTNAALRFPEGTTPAGLIQRFNLKPREVEAVFVNGKVAPLQTKLEDQDRVALVPPGTPGPYRLILGMISKKNDPITGE